MAVKAAATGQRILESVSSLVLTEQQIGMLRLQLAATNGDKREVARILGGMLPVTSTMEIVAEHLLGQMDRGEILDLVVPKAKASAQDQEVCAVTGEPRRAPAWFNPPAGPQKATDPIKSDDAG